MKIIRINPNNLTHVAVAVPVAVVLTVGVFETWEWLKKKMHKPAHA